MLRDRAGVIPAVAGAPKRAPGSGSSLLWLVRVIGAMAAAAVVLALPAAAQAATDTGPAPDCGCGHVTQYSYAGPTAAATGSPTYLVFTPDSYTGLKRVPLVVVTHGSNSTAAEMLAGFGLDRMAEKYGFIVMYPDDNDNLHPGPVAWGQSVGAVWQADVAMIAAMTRDVMARYDINRQRVYELGFSAGAIVTSDLGATYPDLYAGIGIMSGAPFDSPGFAACETGQDPTANGHDPQLLSDSYGAFEAEGRHARVMPVFVFNGDADGTVNPLCDQLATEQWLTTDNLVIDGQTSGPLSTTPASDTPGKVPGGHAYDVYDYKQPSGCMIAQHWIVHGMGHALSGTQLTDPQGPSEAAAAWAFLSHYTLRSTSRKCAQVSGNDPSVEPDSFGSTPAGSATTVQQTTAQPANTLTAYRNQVSIAYLPTSGACVSHVQNTPGCRAYSSEALQAAGATPGSELAVGGFKFQWPDTSSGRPDSVSPAGQTIPVNASLGTNTVAILGAAEQGLTTAPAFTVVELHYATGTGSGDVREVTFSNWDGLISGAANNGSATAGPNELRSDFEVLNSAVPVSDPASVYSVTVPVDPSRRLVSVTFADTNPSIRMFDLQPATTRQQP
jgi:poly(hydroxyalkanoate) depolymerase family esterase